VFTTARHLSLSWARWIQSTAHSFSLRFVLKLSYHLRLDLPSGLFSLGFTKFYMLFSSILSTHLTFLDFTPVKLDEAPHYEIFSGLPLHPLSWITECTVQTYTNYKFKKKQFRVTPISKAKHTPCLPYPQYILLHKNTWCGRLNFRGRL
jgi:hypothetical protein